MSINIYSKFEVNQGGVVVCLYIDNIIIFDGNMHVINMFNHYCHLFFEINLNEHNVILKIKLSKSNIANFMSKDYFIKNLRSSNFFSK